MMVSGSVALFLLVCVQVACTVYVYKERAVCLACNNVKKPEDCKTFREIYPNERCYAQRNLRNGAFVYRFGYKTETTCDSLPEKADVCQECCTGNLCNQRLCRAPEDEIHLACLAGKEVSGFSMDTRITYCKEDTMCYMGDVQHTRPHRHNYGCLPTATCDAAASSSSCQKCCSQDGCNIHLCHTLVQDPVVRHAPHSAPPALGKGKANCWELRNEGGFTKTGLYEISPPPSYTPLMVWCDMTTDGGGWTILQRRYDGSVNFQRTFQDYEEGFGDVNAEYWVGLEAIHSMTTHGAMQLRVDLCYSQRNKEDTAGFAKYNDFSISNQADTYRIHAGTYLSESTMVDMLGFHNHQVFQTTGVCASRFYGGWWYRNLPNCVKANLNGGNYRVRRGQGILWRNFGIDNFKSMTSSEMKIRPVQVTGDPSRPYVCPIS